MKKVSTIRKEERKLRKFITENIGSYNKDPKMKDRLLEAMAANAILIWVQDKCKWTPSKSYGERNKDERRN